MLRGRGIGKVAESPRKGQNQVTDCPPQIHACVTPGPRLKRFPIPPSQALFSLFLSSLSLPPLSLSRTFSPFPSSSFKQSTIRREMSDPKYAYPYPAQGYYQGPPVMAPPQYAARPPRRAGFLEGCLAALCCCCLIDECCCDPSIIFVS
ncbi:uncharacterized protein LOC110008298 [Amborella trichopoda]|uniref:uncharacterized protein LOC110008298 n=1 Tax=Amborella trichopoda TaxID=13333 RepID=UPI0009C05428|nr:uncharacterized protein LOC110008298 [Amborella trichopoda]|eukprot:XP_020530606.1 uncharacterized protein LOC110008298 [Amborella trichopoda]